MAETKYELRTVTIENLAPFFTTGVLRFSDPQKVSEGDDIVLTNNGYLAGQVKTITGKLTLSIAGVGGNINIIKQLKRKTEYTNITVVAVNNSGEVVTFFFQDIARKTMFENQIGIQDAPEQDINFVYGKDVIIS